MIRVNLIGDQGVRRRSVWIGPASIRRYAEAGILTATVVAIAIWAGSLRDSVERLDREIGIYQVEQTDPIDASAELRELEARRAELQQRTAAIERVGTRETLTRTLENMESTIPANVWLLEVSQKNTDVTVKGLAATIAEVSEFVANLQISGEFSGPVEIVDTEKASHASGRELVRFSLKATVGH